MLIFRLKRAFITEVLPIHPAKPIYVIELKKSKNRKTTYEDPLQGGDRADYVDQIKKLTMIPHGQHWIAKYFTPPKTNSKLSKIRLSLIIFLANGLEKEFSKNWI